MKMAHMAACADSMSSASARKGARIGSTESSAEAPRPEIADDLSPVELDVDARVRSCWYWYC